jgi:osmotically-inducible protein OsmY
MTRRATRDRDRNAPRIGIAMDLASGPSTHRASLTPEHPVLPESCLYILIPIDLRLLPTILQPRPLPPASMTASYRCMSMSGTATRASPRRRPEQQSDAAVSVRANRALDQHPFVSRVRSRPQSIGAVTLSGIVPYEHQRLAAEQAMFDLVGVRKVINRVRVEPGGRVGATVATAISSALAELGRGVARRVAVMADRATAMFRRTASTWGESRRADMAARSVPGVRRVMNLIIVQG